MPEAIERATTQRPLRVAFDVGPLTGPLTGVGVAVEQIRDALTRRSDVELAPYACTFRGDLQPGTKRLPLPAAVAHQLWSRLGRPRVDRWLAPADVIHGANYVVPPSRIGRVVSVYDCWFLRHPERAHAQVVRAGEVLRRAVADGATVHASSQATADAVVELLGAHSVEVVHLAPLPLEPPTHDDQIPPPLLQALAGRSFLLALGTLERRKNLPRLIAAFAPVAANDPALTLVIAGGDGDDRAGVDAAIGALAPELRSRVLLTGRVDTRTKTWLLAHAHVLAYPSLDEGFGFPLLEAMQHDLPIVASRVGSIPEIAGGAALLVEPDDTTAISDSLHRAIYDTELRDLLRSMSRAELARFDWAQTAAQLTTIYRRVADNGLER